MEKGEPQRRTDLPAPYRSPWSGLAEALGAVGADLRLALRRLWRRNLEGDLPRPSFWPEGLSALFLPLVLVGVALLAALLFHLIRPLHQPAPAVAPALSPPSALEGAGDRAPLPGSVLGDAGRADGSNGEGGANGVDAAPERPAMFSVRSRSGESLQQDSLGKRTPAAPRPAASAATASGSGESRTGDAPGTGPPTPELQLDPLLALLTQGEEAELLLAARPDPLHGRLTLTLSPAAETLPEASLQTQADRWQQRAREAGYDRLELRDPRGHLRGRRALVGSGMILLASPPPA